MECKKKVKMATLCVECQVTALSFADTTKKICKHKSTVGNVRSQMVLDKQ